MKKFVTYFICLALFALCIGCNDSYHRGDYFRMLGEEETEGEIDGDVVVPVFDCVNLVNYEDFDFRKPAPKKDKKDKDKEEEKTESEVTREKAATVGAVTYMKAAVSRRDPYRLEMIDCIETEIDNLEEGGNSYYWKNRTWLLIRNRDMERPDTDEVNLVNFASCTQIQNAQCLYVN